MAIFYLFIYFSTVWFRVNVVRFFFLISFQHSSQISRMRTWSNPEDLQPRRRFLHTTVAGQSFRIFPQSVYRLRVSTTTGKQRFRTESVPNSKCGHFVGQKRFRTVIVISIIILWYQTICFVWMRYVQRDFATH